MFESFFPKPKIFLMSLVVWIALVIAVYYSVGESLAILLGFQFAEEGAPTVVGLGYFITSEFIWFDIYYLASTLLFFGFWSIYCPHK